MMQARPTSASQPGKLSARSQVPHNGAPIVGGRHGNVEVHGVAFQHVDVALMPDQPGRLPAIVRIPHDDAVVRHRRQDLHRKLSMQRWIANSRLLINSMTLVLLTGAVGSSNLGC